MMVGRLAFTGLDSVRGSGFGSAGALRRRAGRVFAVRGPGGPGIVEHHRFVEENLAVSTMPLSQWNRCRRRAAWRPHPPGHTGAKCLPEMDPRSVCTWRSGFPDSDEHTNSIIVRNAGKYLRIGCLAGCRMRAPGQAKDFMGHFVVLPWGMNYGSLRAVGRCG